MFSLDSLGNRLVTPSNAVDPTFTAADSIIGQQYFAGANGELAVIVPSWHANHLVQRAFIGQQRRAGKAVLHYDLHDNILTSNAQLTIDCFNAIGERLKRDVAEKIHQQPELRVNYFAASLGCAILLKALGDRRLPLGDIHLIVPGGSLAKAVWTGSRTQYLREQFEAKHTSLEQLIVQWHDLAPTYQASKIHSTNVQIVVSDADEVIPPATAYELADAFRASGNKVTVNTNQHLGHYGTMIAAALKNPFKVLY